jgi:hypothetical protein
MGLFKAAKSEQARPSNPNIYEMFGQPEQRAPQPQPVMHSAPNSSYNLSNLSKLDSIYTGPMGWH